MPTSREILDSLFKQVFGKVFVSVRALSGGEINEVYLVVFEDGQEVVVRIAGEVALPFTAEKWAIEKARKVGVPAPVVLHIGEIGEAGKKKPVMVQEKLPGTSFREHMVRLNKQEQRKILMQAGVLLAKLHSISIQGFGDIDEQGRGKYDTWAAYIGQYFQGDSYRSALQGVGLAGAMVDLSFSYLKELRGRNVASAVLLHDDLDPSHILLEGTEITGIVDFGNAKGGRPLHEFARWDMYWGGVFPTELLVEGYGNVLITNFREQKDFYLEKLHQAVRAMEYYYFYGKPQTQKKGVELTKQTIKETLQQLKNF